MKRKIGLCVFIEESFTDATFKVMASFIFICMRIFLRQCFFVAPFLYFQPKNQLKEQGQFLCLKAAFIYKTMRFRIMKKIENRWELRLQRSNHTIFPRGIKRLKSVPNFVLFFFQSPCAEKHINKQTKTVKFPSHFSLFSHK